MNKLNGRPKIKISTTKASRNGKMPTTSGAPAKAKTAYPDYQITAGEE